MDNEIVKSDIIAGGLGYVVIGGKIRGVAAIQTDNKGHSFTLTIGKPFCTEPVTEDADFEVVQPKQIENNPLS